MFSRLPSYQTLQPAVTPECKLAYESPQNLAIELSKSILYDNIDTVNAKSLDDLKSLTSHGDCDSLWNGKPQQYFESIHYSDNGDEEDNWSSNIKILFLKYVT